jgi:hypothetical protein
LKTEIKGIIKKSLKLSFASAFWLVFGFIILVAGITEGIGLSIVLAILFGAGYWTIVKVTKFYIKKGRQLKGSVE